MSEEDKEATKKIFVWDHLCWIDTAGNERSIEELGISKKNKGE